MVSGEGTGDESLEERADFLLLPVRREVGLLMSFRGDLGLLNSI
jgi:hypothetical protein